jgi:hypothetical protein
MLQVHVCPLVNMYCDMLQWLWPAIGDVAFLLESHFYIAAYVCLCVVIVPFSGLL